MCWEIGQAKAVNMHHNLCASYHILVQSDDGCHHIYYLDELVFFTLCQNGEEQARQLVVVDTAS